MAFQLPPSPPPPNGSVLALLAALSHGNGGHDAHQRALRARDDALSSSPEGYGDLCTQFCRVLACPSPERVPESELKKLHDSDVEAFGKCCGWLMEARQNNNNGGALNRDDDPSCRAKRQQGMVHWNALRQMAGLLLKNALVTPPLPKNVPLDALGRVLPGHASRMELLPPFAVEIKMGLLTCIADGEPGVRNAASTAIARCCAAAVHLEKSLGAFAVKNWGELVPFLLSCVVHGNGAAAAGGGADAAVRTLAESAAMGALLTLRKLLEDIPNRLVKEAPDSSFHDLVPALLRSLTSASELVRKEALACLNSFIFPMPGSLVAHMNEYLAGLSSLAADPNAEVRRLVCQGIVSLLSHRAEYLQPHIASVAEFMLRATGDANPDVALEACEFWLTFASLDEDACGQHMMEALVGLFPRLLPQLLKGMVYPPEKIEELTEANALEAAGNDDRAQDVAPVFHRSHAKGQHDSDDESSDEEDMDDDHEWTLRKCSAASLDALAGMFGAANVLAPLLPALQEGLGHADPWVREASILALGAVADGCKDEMAPHLPRLHPFLLQQLTSPESLPQLRCIAAWTLARYASYAVDQAHAAANGGGGDPSLAGQVADALCGGLLDPHRRVQVATCSALGVFVESAGELMTPYLEPVYRMLVRALQKYGTRSRLVLFDTLGVMADYVGPAIGEGALPGMYVPPLLQLWNDTAVDNPFDRTLLPLMECLGSSVICCGLNFQPWALETFEMAMSTIEACQIIISHEDDLGDIDEDMTDPIICAADLLDGLVEGLGGNFAALVNGSAKFAPTFPNTLIALAEHFVPGVRMSGFALVGDLARQAPTLIEAGLPKILSEAIMSIDPMHPSMCNNAVWSVGEVCIRCAGNSAPLAPHASNLLSSLIPLLMGNAVDMDGNEVHIPGIAENAACTAGRLALVDANFVAPDLGRFLLGWLDGMTKISNPIERRDAFGGFVAAVRANPNSIQQAAGQSSVGDIITSILFAVVSWHIPSNDMSPDLLTGPYRFEPFPHEFSELLSSLQQLLRDLKTSMGDAWKEVADPMPPNIKRLMQEVYHI